MIEHIVYPGEACSHEYKEIYDGFECIYCGYQVPPWYFDEPEPDYDVMEDDNYE